MESRALCNACGFLFHPLRDILSHQFTTSAQLFLHMRKIIHIDMDAFFASVEQRDHPELRGKPIAVGYDDVRGVVSTASYEARKYGVRSAMSMQIAKRMCKDLIVVPGRYERYKEVSWAIHSIFHDYTDLVEPLSLDEAFLDVTHNKKGMPLASEIAKEIKQRIKDELHLTASAGISYNKLLAKIASDYHKPDGLYIIHPDQALDFIAQLQVEDLWGVGPKTAQKMHKMGIFNGEQLRQCSVGHLKSVFGKMGPVFYNYARGIDERPVVTNYVRKSVGCEHTFSEDLIRPSAILIALYHLVVELTERLEKSKFVGKTVTLKIKYNDFQQITRSITTHKKLQTKKDILPLAKQLLHQIHYSNMHPIRLMGLTVSNSVTEDGKIKTEWVQLELDFKV